MADSAHNGDATVIAPAPRRTAPETAQDDHRARAVAHDAWQQPPLERSLRKDGEAWTRLDRFLAERSPAKALQCWLGLTPGAPFPFDKAELLRRLEQDIAHLDALLGAQVDAILHHPRFQRLEASWRGLEYLTSQVESTDEVKVRVLNVSWNEVARDLEKAIEFDQSALFNKVYNEEFGSPGGEPFGALLGDYTVRHRPGPDHPTDDIAVLQGLSQVAAAAFAPFVASADPAFFGLNSFTELGRPFDLSGTFRQTEYLRWRSFRETEDARFVGLTLPRVLMRLPYEDDGSRTDNFRYAEEVEGPDNTRYLWGNAVYAFGAVLARAFRESGWLANIHGVQRGVESGGVVTGLPLHCFGTDAVGVAPKYATDVLITDHQEKELGELGFIPLCHCKDTEWSAFYGSASVQSPKQYDRTPATINARLSATLQYIFCASRFAHYLKVIGRDKVGTFQDPEECETYLHRWLLNYTTGAEDATLESKAKYPLREARVQVRELPGKPGCYLGVFHLRPHFQLDHVTSGIKLVTELAPGAES